MQLEVEFALRPEPGPRARPPCAVEPDADTNLAELVEVLVHPPGKVADVSVDERALKSPALGRELLHQAEIVVAFVIAGRERHA
jgi:hypothetical protein